MDTDNTQIELNLAIRALQERTEAEQKAANDLLGLQISNAQRLYNIQQEYLNRETKERLEAEQYINERLIKMGFKTAAITAKSLEERLKDIDKQEKADLKGKRGGAAVKIRKEYAIKRKKEIEFQKEVDKATEIRRKEEDKYTKNKVKEQKQAAQSFYKNLGDVWTANSADVKEELMARGISAEDADKAIRSAKAQATLNAITGFAKQLEGTINNIGSAKSEIDTRLQGSKNWNIAGSYWELMSKDIVRNVGMNPLVKQADVVDNLKTLVGKGIAFNVEQRAFIDTISDKIANTFNAADGALLKLVRIQQADTTAARLGMESALTAFLNNMYETTEYMTDAADAIRASIYEASALMGAAESTAFEYQVQKWMGSLYSAGFSNTEGLAGALGKLAAGDISGIDNGGYGNLLIMAANRANLSIAEILADGLDDSETNQLMKAMVEYLGEIYDETKNSKVVAQQFANVYGLTASDLKAAANLSRDTGNISRNNLSYGGMLGQLALMASTAMIRTSTGEMMTNLFENLKYGISQNMATNPALYASYTIASMLDDTTGGIAIPTIGAWAAGTGTEVDLETTVADLIRVGSLGAGLLGGIGTMMTGLGSYGGMLGSLAGFGISSLLSPAKLNRGTGVNALSIFSGTSTSSSGFVGNSDSSDVQNKAIGDASESAEQTAEAKQDEQQDTKLSTVDEHVVQIYELLNSVINGLDSIKVDMGDVATWRDVMGGRS